jgi:hypothetical protein
MSNSHCTWQDTRDDAIVAYVYGDIEPAERERFETHLAACPACRTEIEELGVVRQQLARWSPPEPARALSFSPPPVPRRSSWDLLGDIPAWAQVAAALLVLGISAGIANLEIRYDDRGLTVRTGWQAPAAPAADTATDGITAARTAQTAPAAAAPVAGTDAPWRAEFATLSEELRRESSDEATLRRVRALIAESERRQQSELALRVAELTLEVDKRREGDLVRVQRAIDAVGTSAGVAVLRNQQLINSLALRVGQRQ